MKIDTKARIAIGAILDVAMHGKDRPVRLADISLRQGVSQSYLEHVFQILVHGGFLAGVRGPGGGYQLSRSLATVSVADVFAAVSTAGPGQETRRFPPPDSLDESTITAELWGGLDDHLSAYLRNVSLESVLANVIARTDYRERDPVATRGAEFPGERRVRPRSHSPMLSAR